LQQFFIKDIGFRNARIILVLKTSIQNFERERVDR
jgi:hypothetical protein